MPSASAAPRIPADEQGVRPETDGGVRRRGRAQPIIDVQGPVGKVFFVNGNALTVFENLSCRIEKGSFLSIVGPSGCGKSTLLKLISGLEPPTKGEVVFNDEADRRPGQGHDLCVPAIHQVDLSLAHRDPERRVRAEQLQDAGARREARERCLEYIRLVGLDGYENYYPYQLSGGMQQRVCIARALICEPDVLLMDEPFSAVDALTRAILQELILKIWETIPVTILFVTHDVEEAVFLSSRIVSLSQDAGHHPRGCGDRPAVSARPDQDARGRALHRASAIGCSPASSCRRKARPRPPACGTRASWRMKKRWPGFLLFAAAAAGLGTRARPANWSIRSRFRASA